MVDNDVMAQLYAPLEVRTRRGAGNQQFKYVSSSDVIDRMNKVFMGRWSTTVISSELVEDFVVVHVRVTVIDADNHEFSHDGYGSSIVARFNSGQKAGKIVDIGNSYKSSLSTAIRSACTRFGVALYLDKDHWEEDTVGTSTNTPTTKYKESGDIPPTFAPPEVKAPVVQKTTPEVKAAQTQEVPTVPVPPVNTPVKEAIEPPAQDVVVPPVVEKQEVPVPPTTATTPPSTVPSVPKVKVPTDTAIPRPPSTGPVSTTTTSDGPASNITDVQMAALEALLSLRDVKYEDLAKEAFEANKIPSDTIPAKESLDYKQAVAVISYGNHLYRKQ